MTLKYANRLATDTTVFWTIYRLRRPAPDTTLRLPSIEEILNEMVENCEWENPPTDRTVRTSLERLEDAGAIIVQGQGKYRTFAYDFQKAYDYLDLFQPSRSSRRIIRKQLRVWGILDRTGRLILENLFEIVPGFRDWLREFIASSLRLQIREHYTGEMWEMHEALLADRRLANEGVDLRSLSPAERSHAFHRAREQNRAERKVMSVDHMEAHIRTKLNDGKLF